MDIINKITKKISSGVETVSKTANDAIETTKLKNMINKTQSEINVKYAEIGRIVKQELEESINNEDIKRICSEIDQLLELISENNDKINAIKGVKVCPECGAKLADDDAFCPDCGKKQPEKEQAENSQPQATAEENVEQAESIVEEMEKPVIESAVISCSECGAMCDSDTKFCPQCGTKIG